jgi:hypothetical protein
MERLWGLELTISETFDSPVPDASSFGHVVHPVRYHPSYTTRRIICNTRPTRNKMDVCPDIGAAKTARRHTLFPNW